MAFFVCLEWDFLQRFSVGDGLKIKIFNFNFKTVPEGKLIRNEKSLRKKEGRREVYEKTKKKAKGNKIYSHISGCSNNSHSYNHKHSKKQ